jgi:hypothetical protein
MRVFLFNESVNVMSFELNGYEIVNHAISKETANLLSLEFNMVRDNVFLLNHVDLNQVGFNNDSIEKCFAWYGAYCFESLLLMVKPIVEKVVGKTLHPTYSYARIYYNGAIMKVHKDRPSCEYSATITIDVDETGPWDIWMENLNGETNPIKIPVGSMVVYQGGKLKHWREEYKGTKQIQAFLHYVDADGEYASNMYDGRVGLGMPGGLSERILNGL